ncbi:hypothetical protein Tco_1448928 [Tanacetum coccineum]
MVTVRTSLTGFSGETIWPLGQLRILVTIGDADQYTKAWMNFMIVRSRGRHTMVSDGEDRHKRIQAVAHPHPRMIKNSHQNLKVAIHPNFPDQEVAIGGTLSLAGPEHQLNIREGYSPVRQKKRGQAPERVKAIQAKVQKIVATEIMREVYYHDWLSNPVMVKKLDGSWRMYVDLTDLNKACPQDCYPLLEIDWKIESLCGYLLRRLQRIS